MSKNRDLTLPLEFSSYDQPLNSIEIGDLDEVVNPVPDWMFGSSQADPDDSMNFSFSSEASSCSGASVVRDSFKADLDKCLWNAPNDFAELDPKAAREIDCSATNISQSFIDLFTAVQRDVSEVPFDYESESI